MQIALSLTHSTEKKDRDILFKKTSTQLTPRICPYMHTYFLGGSIKEEKYAPKYQICHFFPLLSNLVEEGVMILEDVFPLFLKYCLFCCRFHWGNEWTNFPGERESWIILGCIPSHMCGYSCQIFTKSYGNTIFAHIFGKRKGVFFSSLESSSTLCCFEQKRLAGSRTYGVYSSCCCCPLALAG